MISWLVMEVSRMGEDRLRSALGVLDDGGRMWSTGSYIPSGGRLLFAGVVLPDRLCVFAVGGRVEPGETLLEALVREGREEARVQLDPVDSASTLVHLGGDLHETVSLGGDLSPRPALVWRGEVNLSEEPLDYLAAVWEAGYRGEPHPGAEVDLLLWVAEGEVAAGDWGGLQAVGGELPPGRPVRPVGSALLAPLWVSRRGSGPTDGLGEGLGIGAALMRRYGAREGLLGHSEKVAMVSAAVGRRLVAAGGTLDLSALSICAVCHDIGKTPGAAGIEGADHAEVSARVMEIEGMGELAGPVGRHMLPSVVSGLGDDLATAVLFYADKVVHVEYVGIEERLDELKARRPDLASSIEPARGPLRELEARLASMAGLSVDELRTVTAAASLSEGVLP